MWNYHGKGMQMGSDWTYQRQSTYGNLLFTGPLKSTEIREIRSLGRVALASVSLLWKLGFNSAQIFYRQKQQIFLSHEVVQGSDTKVKGQIPGSPRGAWFDFDESSSRTAAVIPEGSGKCLGPHMLHQECAQLDSWKYRVQFSMKTRSNYFWILFLLTDPTWRPWSLGQ